MTTTGPSVRMHTQARRRGAETPASTTTAAQLALTFARQGHWQFQEQAVLCCLQCLVQGLELRYVVCVCIVLQGSCKRGEACRFAHGVFECWLHPAKYCTQLCKEASTCSRSVCFFAHTLAELRTPPEEPPIPALVSRGMSRNSLQAEDPWASFAAASAFDHPTANSAPLPDASAAWAQLLDCSPAGIDNVASLMEKMKLQSGSPSPSAAPFGLGVAGSTFFTPPVSPGNNSRSLRNTMSPGTHTWGLWGCADHLKTVKVLTWGETRP